MIYFGACPKCHGDVASSKDVYGSFLSCLQCGLMHDIETKPAVVVKPRPTPVWFADEEPLAKAA